MSEAKSRSLEKGVCACCAKQAHLQNSHVLPAFVFRWLRNRSPKGHLRFTETPNKRVQDGLKLPWLCGECEELFSTFETAFATKVFHPWHAGNHLIPYGPWLMKFSVSVSWRVLRFLRGRNKNATYTVEQIALMDQAEKRWRAFLFEEENHPDRFEQHILIFDEIGSTSVKDLPPNINRFLMGAVTFDIVGSSSTLMTFAKLGRFMIFGMIQKGQDQWKGTKIHVNNGILKPERLTVPYGLLGLICDKANYVSEKMQQVSEEQRKKIETNVIENKKEFIKSDQFRSIMADVRMFGEDAALWKNKTKLR